MKIRKISPRMAANRTTRRRLRSALFPPNFFLTGTRAASIQLERISPRVVRKIKAMGMPKRA